MIIFDDLNYNEPIKIYDKKFDQIYDKASNQIDTNSFFSFSIGDITSPYISNSEPLQEVVDHFIKLIKKEDQENSLNNKNISLRTVKLLKNIEDQVG